MEPDRTRHQVVIVGGGITGLTLALMLQHLNVDYVLLEAYKTVTPSAGASIGLFANGLRVLDQLGLYDEIATKGQRVEVSMSRDSGTGKRFMTRRSNPVLEERHGYPNVFMARSTLLNILYSHISDKQRLLVNKKVRQVETLQDHALVYTEDGSIYEGQIIVGADGVHSTIRREMWRNADAKDPGAIPEKDRENITCEHACIFGTVRPDPNVPLDVAPGELVGSSGTGTLGGLMGGPNGDIYYFWFWALPKSERSCPVDKIPRFTEEDKQRQLADGNSAIMTDSGIRLEKFSERLETSGVTALPNFVMQRWHYGRIVIIGDAAHKFNPLVGQGGNSCIESCVSLVNSLKKSLGSQISEQVSWEEATLAEAFRRVEEQRVDRVTFMVEQCQNAMRGCAWESWWTKMLQKLVVASLPLGKFVDFYSALITPGLRLDDFKDPSKVHKWPYDDEKPLKVQIAS